MNRFLPFRYVIDFPVRLILGKPTGVAALSELSIQWLFGAVLCAFAALLWRAGVRRYEAFGG